MYVNDVQNFQKMQAFLKGGSIKPKDKESQQKQLETSTSSVKDKKQRKPQPWVEK
jgi:hypothetical protein